MRPADLVLKLIFELVDRVGGLAPQNLGWAAMPNLLREFICAEPSDTRVRRLKLLHILYNVRFARIFLLRDI